MDRDTQLAMKRGRYWVGIAGILSKLLGLGLTLALVRLLPLDSFGQLTLGLNYLAFYAAFTGLGLFQSILQQGSGKSAEDIQGYSGYALAWGGLGQMMIGLAFVFFGRADFGTLVVPLVFRLLGLWYAEHMRAVLRAKMQIKRAAVVDLCSSVLSVVLAIAMSWQGGTAQDAVWGMAVGGALPYLFIKKDVPRFAGLSDPVSFWRFGLVTGVTTQVASALWLLDMYFVGQVLEAKAVVDYRLATLLPFNLAIISQVFLSADYPQLCARHTDRGFLQDYFKRYIHRVSSLMLIGGLGVYFLAPWFLEVIGKARPDLSLFPGLLTAMWIQVVFRAPLSHLMAAVGRPRLNLLLHSVGIAMAFVGYPFVLKEFGLIGITWAVAGLQALITIVLYIGWKQRF